MIDNLITNAVNYTPQKGEIHIAVSKKDTKTILTIEDNGPGIPESERENVFKRFYRILGSDVIGSGLGLSIVKDIVSSHDAVIAIKDGQNGIGTKFEIIFPT